MIDVENQVFTKVASELRLLFPGIFVSSEYTRTPAQFPAVFLCEIENNADMGTMTQEAVETHAVLTYEAQVYSNLKTGRKSQCKEIYAALDAVMCGLGFRRVSANFIPNLEDETISRMVGRYRAAVSQDNVIYRR